MTFRNVRKLHNGDEVIAKGNGESIRVLSVVLKPFGRGTAAYKGTALIEIEGIGNKSGYGRWDHDGVR